MSAPVTYAGATWQSARGWCLWIMRHHSAPQTAQNGQNAALDAFRAEVLREAAEALRVEHRRIFWATKPDTCAEAEFLDRMAAAGQVGKVTVPSGETTQPAPDYRAAVAEALRLLETAPEAFQPAPSQNITAAAHLLRQAHEAKDHA